MPPPFKSLDLLQTHNFKCCAEIRKETTTTFQRMLRLYIYGEGKIRRKERVKLGDDIR
jgi:hypothetical protein